MKRLSLFLVLFLVACASPDHTPPPGSSEADTTLSPGNSAGHGNADSAHVAHKKDK